MALEPGATGGAGGAGGAGGGAGRLRLSSFQSLSQGLPSGFTPSGAATLNGTVYLVGAAAGQGGVYTLEVSATQWSDAQAPLRAGEVATSVTRSGLSVLVTVADAAGGHGGLLAYDFGPGTWRRTDAPDAPAWQLLKKGSELLLAAGDALWVSTDGGSTFMKRSAGACLTGQVRYLVGSPAAVRIFSVAQSGLCYSDDSGATWNTGLVGGSVTALGAVDSYALLVSSTEGALRSDNYGSTFHPFDAGEQVTGLTLTEGKVFAVTAHGVKVSDDGGQTWADGSNGLPQGQSIDALFVAGNDVLAGLGGQLWLAELSLR